MEWKGPRRAGDLVLDGSEGCHLLEIPFKPKSVPIPVLPIPTDMITGFSNLTLVLPFRTSTEGDEGEWAEPAEGAGHHKVATPTLSVIITHPFLTKKKFILFLFATQEIKKFLCTVRFHEHTLCLGTPWDAMGVGGTSSLFQCMELLHALDGCGGGFWMVKVPPCSSNCSQEVVDRLRLPAVLVNYNI
jgi:hypothetical protein